MWHLNYIYLILITYKMIITKWCNKCEDDKLANTLIFHLMLTSRRHACNKKNEILSKKILYSLLLHFFLIEPLIQTTSFFRLGTN